MNTRLVSLALLTTLIGLSVMGVRGVSGVQAQEAEQEQELEQTSKVECQTGAYGQGQVCGVTTEQKAKQKQKIVIRDGKTVAPHQAVNTAVDFSSVAVLMGLLAMGGASSFGLAKIK